MSFPQCFLKRAAYFSCHGCRTLLSSANHFSKKDSSLAVAKRIPEHNSMFTTFFPVECQSKKFCSAAVEWRNVSSLSDDGSIFLQSKTLESGGSAISAVATLTSRGDINSIVPFENIEEKAEMLLTVYGRNRLFFSDDDIFGIIRFLQKPHLLEAVIKHPAIYSLKEFLLEHECELDETTTKFSERITELLCKQIAKRKENSTGSVGPILQSEG
ncbi:hypothetical protein IE077_003948 [Cardiosporidium cionae]|uniref:Uncharacterized protein n=1 Tax=Cardiosporidium cionae TaxID=476202 RepID=A0ABQ7JEB2_9APIC|nr:hypothetical protein IE077_003948 [Cardiosporidium cionae]|eukprot:KAF8822343.1 hypothetical protein IE077_003948 [Cardiosporidium cionae]